MSYHFNMLTDCRETRPGKWNVADYELALWGEEMDFPAAPEITAAIQKLSVRGTFCEAAAASDWYDAVCGWWRERHGFAMERGWLLFSPSASAVFSNVLNALTAPGEGVLLLTPSHHTVFEAIAENGRRAVECPLVYKNAEYHIDFADLERRLAAPHTALMVLCNPHGPAGRVWNAETLWQIGTLCGKYHVPVLADETGCDLADPGCDYVPFASVSEVCAQNSITYLSPEKPFQLAGLQTSALCIPDAALRRKTQRALRRAGADRPGAFAAAAAVAAFTKGAVWLDALRDHLLENKNLARSFLEKELPQINAVSSQMSHVLWLDCGLVSGNSDVLAAFIREQTGLCLSSGGDCGGNGGRFLSMNLACPAERLLDGLRRLQDALPAYEAWSASLC